MAPALLAAPYVRSRAEQIVGVDATVLDIGVAFLERHGAWPVPWSDLAAAIDAAFERPEEQAT